jgi:hypothetical protein
MNIPNPLKNLDLVAALAKFNPAQYGQAGFGQADYDYLKSIGASDDQIRAKAAEAVSVAKPIADLLGIPERSFNTAAYGQAGFGKADYDFLKSIGASDDYMRAVALSAPSLAEDTAKLLGLQGFAYDPSRRGGPGLDQADYDYLISIGAKPEYIQAVAQAAPSVDPKIAGILGLGPMPTPSPSPVAAPGSGAGQAIPVQAVAKPVEYKASIPAPVRPVAQGDVYGNVFSLATQFPSLYGASNPYMQQPALPVQPQQMRAPVQQAPVPQQPLPVPNIPNPYLDQYNALQANPQAPAAKGQ